MINARIADVAIIAGHDGRAELAVRLDYGDDGCSDVVLDYRVAAKLMKNCNAESVEELVGQSWVELATLGGSD